MVKAAGSEEILIVVDVGNTNTVFGVFRGDDLVASFRLSTDTERTADEYGATLLPLFARAGLEPSRAGSPGPPSPTDGCRTLCCWRSSPMPASARWSPRTD